MNKKMRMFQALLIVAILLLQMIIPIVPIYAKTSENIWKETFENGVDGWKFFDADGDGDTWGCFDARESIYDAFRGNYMLASKSVNRLPDNYAVSPVIAINKKNVSDYDKIRISWYARPFSSISYCESYSVSIYIDDGSDISIDKLKDLTTEYSYTFKAGENYSIASFELKIADYEGKNIRLVFHHKNSSTDTYALQIDEISVDAFYSNASFVQRFGFEEGEESWSFIDADGDKLNWRKSSSIVYEGQESMYSYSKTNEEYNPKDYAISPIIDVSGKTNLQLEWYAGASSKSNYKEHYAVYIYLYNNEEDSSKVPTVEDISKLTPVFEETLDTYEYTKKTVDLNKYINYDKIRVIFYHYIPEGGSAQSSLRIDSISITGIGGTSHTANFFVDGTLFNSQLYNEGSSILSPGFVPGKEGYTFVGWEPEAKVMGTEDIDFNAVFSESTAKLENIKIAKQPTKLEYTEEENFDRTGMEVKACYSDGTEVGVTNYCEITNGENLTKGQTNVTIKYKEEEKTVETTQTITVKEKPPVAQKTLESIKVTTAPTKTAYTEGEKFDKTGMKVIATYSDGTTKEIKNYAYTPAGALKTTDKVITVSYTENGVTKTATQEITVVAKGNSGDEPGGETEKAKLDSIEIKEAPTKTVYTEGEKFDKTGMKVIAKYSDGTTKEIKNYAYTPAGELKTTDKTITVSYTENEVTKTATQEITVVAKGNSGDEPGGETEKAKLDSIEIKEAPTKTVYTEGEKFDKTGMKVIAKYSDGTTKEIKNYAYTPAGALTKKDTTITVSYTENGVTKTDTQKIKIQNKDDGTGAKDKFPDTGAQIPIISGIVLMFAVAVASVVKIKRLTGI